MKTTSALVFLIVILAASIGIQAQKTGQLIINPEIGGFAQAPLTGGNVVRVDTIENWNPPKSHHIESFAELMEKPYKPAGALVTGMVPDPSRGWAVAVTHDREEFERALPEYRRLIAEGKWKEANEVLHVSTSLNVSTKVELFQDREKLGELPEKVGSFFLTLGTPEIEKYGGYLTFLSFTRDPDYPMIGIGKDIGETIHGIVQVEKVKGKGNFEFSFGGKAILAEIIEEE